MFFLAVLTFLKSEILGLNTSGPKWSLAAFLTLTQAHTIQARLLKGGNAPLAPQAEHHDEFRKNKVSFISLTR